MNLEGFTALSQIPLLMQMPFFSALICTNSGHFGAFPQI
jgi:hypothetical protein